MGFRFLETIFAEKLETMISKCAFLRVSIAVVVEIHKDWVSDKSYIGVKNQG